MYSVEIEIAGIGIKIIPDAKFLELKNLNFFKIEDRSDLTYINIYIQDFKIDHYDFPNLDEKEKKALLQTVYFPFRWLSSSIFGYSPFRKAVQRSLDNPEMSHIALNWNRAIIRNYAKNEYYLFYPSEKRHELISPLFIARLRNLVGNIFPNFNSVMIHGASLLLGNKAAVFLAPDEGGKSTLIKQSKGRKILSDDHIVLKKTRDGITVHSTPFGEMTDGILNAELGGFFLIEKAEKFDIEKVKPKEILQFIWNDQFIKWYQFPKSLRVKIFDILNSASSSVPVFRLKLPKNRADWKKIESAIKKNV